MPDARALIQSAQVRGLRLFLDGDKVKVEAPYSLDGDTKALIEELREQKEQVKSILVEEEVKSIGIEEDPILTPNQWYPDFRDFHHKVIAETPRFDYLWLKEHRPDQYQAIRAKESELDAIQEARLSVVMAIIRQWRELVLKSELSE